MNSTGFPAWLTQPPLLQSRIQLPQNPDRQNPEVRGSDFLHDAACGMPVDEPDPAMAWCVRLGKPGVMRHA